MNSPTDWHARILVVEDHPDLAATVCDYLTGAGFDVDYAADGFSALQLASEHQFDVIVLDIMLPKLDGFQVCERLRRDLRSDVPILMLTARDQLEDKLRGLEGGADDYLVKPFDLPELVARLKAIVRRTRGEFEAQVLTVHDLTLDLANRQAQRDGKVLRLSPVIPPKNHWS